MGKCIVLSLGGGGNADYYKSAHHPIPTQGNRENPGNFQNKSVTSPFNWLPRYILYLPKLKGRGRIFLWLQDGDRIMRLPPRVLGCHKSWKGLFFCEIWYNPTGPLPPPPPSFVFIRPLQMQGMEFYDKFIDRFLDISKIKNPAKQMSSNNLEPSKANALG